MDIEFGNSGSLDTNETGWFVGFSDWTKSTGNNLRNLPFDSCHKGLCIKWYEHKVGIPNGEAKPISTGRTISILVGDSGEFKLEYSSTEIYKPENTKEFTLTESGDFVIWGSNIYHRAYCLKPSKILTVRWEPL